MSTENTPGETTQPQAAEAAPATEAFNVDNIIADLTSSFEASPTTPEAPIEAPAPEIQEPPTQEAAAPEPKEMLSPALAEKSRREREARAEIETLKGARDQEVKQAREQLLNELKQNPQEFIAKYGIDNPGDLAMHFYAADLGEDAPDDLKAQIGISDLDRYKAQQAEEMQRLRLEIEQRETMARNQATIDQYNGFLSDVPAELPYLQVEAQHDQREVLQTMAQVADHMYQRDGKYPPAGVVAQAIEREIASQAARYSAIGKPQINVEPPQTEPVETSTKTLSTEHSGTSAQKVAVGEDALFEEALSMFEGMYQK